MTEYSAPGDPLRQVQAAEHRQRFLAEASRLLAESLDYEATLRTVARLAVPDIADWCVVDLLQEDDAIARVAIEHRDEGRRGLAADLLDRFSPRADAPAGPSEVIRTGVTEFLSPVPEAFLRAMAPEPERLRLLTTLGLHSYVSVALSSRGRIMGSISFFTDAERTLNVDDLAMAEDLARRAATAIDNAMLYEQAQRALRAREEMLAIVSHDLRTPLAAIVTGAALQIAAAPAGESGRRIRQRAEAIQRAAQHMARLISDLTDIGQIDTGRLTLVKSPQDPDALAREVVDTLQPVAAEYRSQLQQSAAGPLPPIECDGDRVVQVLSNLVSNAVKAGAPTVTVGVTAGAAEVVFTVADTGPGIAAADLPHMFDRYWRGQRSSYKGTGLGLPICKGIVDAHGGRIWAESVVGAGTTFHVALPR